MARLEAGRRRGSERILLKRAGRGAWRFALAALVIAFVATRVPWRDRVRESGAGTWVEGRLEGAWRSEEIGFSLDEGVIVPEEWNAVWAVSLREGDQALLLREAGVEWEPGLWTVLRGLRLTAILGLLIAVLGGMLCGVTRWWRLLRVCGAPTPYGTALRLSLLGMFFNLVVPGLTGGDVVKAGMAVKEHPEKRAAALMAVGLDRVIGLWTLLWIAAGTAWILRGELRVLLAPLIGVCLVSTLGMIVLGWPRLRDALGAQRILRWMPGRLMGVLDALRSVAERPVEVLIAIVLSAANHVCIGFAVFAVARGIGDDTPFVGCLAASVVASAVSAIPLAPGGWGVGEAAYAAMFSMLGSGQAVGYAVSVSYRLCQTGVSLLCGFALWRGGMGRLRDEQRLEASR